MLPVDGMGAGLVEWFSEEDEGKGERGERTNRAKESVVLRVDQLVVFAEVDAIRCAVRFVANVFRERGVADLGPMARTQRNWLINMISTPETTTGLGTHLRGLVQHGKRHALQLRRCISIQIGARQIIGIRQRDRRRAEMELSLVGDGIRVLARSAPALDIFPLANPARH